MARGPAATPSTRDPLDNSHAQDAKASKRRCVQSACVPCRKRKSKCDGGTPVCATCTAVYRTECHYDAESESRRTKLGLTHNNNNAGIKRDASRVAASSSEDFSSAEFIINSLRKLPEENVYEFIQHIRRDPSLDTNALAEQWRKNETLTPNTPVNVQSLESELSVLLGKPTVTLNGQSRHFGHSASLGLVPEEENFCGGRLRTNLVKPERQGSTWTNVTDDLEFVEKLLDLYFTWSHPFYVLFSRECFYKDFKAGRDKYCCSLLVNAICAYACHLTDDPAGRTDPNNFRTAGDHFFAEARRMLFDDETPSLTTVQALCIMSMREPSTGRDSSGFGYMGRCIRMCIELGLHLNYGADATLNLTPSEVEVRKVTFWGCFTVDTVWTIVMGRISQIPRAAITLDKPILEETPGPSKAVPGTSHNSAGIVTTRLFLQEFTSLSELVNDNNYMFFAPKEPLTSLKLLDCYRKYQEWYNKLSPAMRLEGKKETEPHILVLHMLYYTIIVHLFRPLLKVDLIHSNIQPRAICINAANEVSKLVRLYRKFCSFRTAHLLIPHILLTVGVVHLLYSKDNETSKRNLVESLQGLEDLHECHYFGARSFRIIHTLAKTWNLPFPEELRNSRLIPKSDPDKPHGTVSPPTDPLLMAPNSQTITGNRIGPGRIHPLPPQRRESLTMFASQNQNRQQLVTHLANSRPSSVVSSQGHQSPAVGHTPIQDVYNGLPISNYQYSQSMSTSATMPTTMTSPTQDTGEGMFWNPIPGMPGPILPRHNYQQMSPMGLETVLHTTDLEDRINRQGFRSVDDWQSSHINNYAGVYDGSNNHYPSNRCYPSHRTSHGNNFVSQQDATGFSQGAHDGHAQESFDAAGWWQGPNGSSGPMS